MLRTKRVAIEKTRMAYVLGTPVDPDAEILAMPITALGITLHLEPTYPFSPPTLIRDGDYVEKALQRQVDRIRPLTTAYHLVLPCVCCSPIRFAWCPTYGIREVLDEYVKLSTRLNQLEGYADVLPGLPFDDAVHSYILNFL
jgi:hypothetical protein